MSTNIASNHDNHNATLYDHQSYITIDTKRFPPTTKTLAKKLRSVAKGESSLRARSISKSHRIYVFPKEARNDKNSTLFKETQLFFHNDNDDINEFYHVMVWCGKGGAWTKPRFKFRELWPQITLKNLLSMQEQELKLTASLQQKIVDMIAPIQHRQAEIYKDMCKLLEHNKTYKLDNVQSVSVYQSTGQTHLEISNNTDNKKTSITINKYQGTIIHVQPSQFPDASHHNHDVLSVSQQEVLSTLFKNAVNAYTNH